MSRILYWFVEFMARLHSKIFAINDSSGLALTDKQLHFIIIGAFGFALIFVIQPIVKWLVSHNFELFVSFTYVFTLIVVLSFAIEIGQAWTGTGDLDFYDVAAGMLGFLVFFCVYLIGYLIFKGIKANKT